MQVFFAFLWIGLFKTLLMWLFNTYSWCCFSHVNIVFPELEVEWLCIKKLGHAFDDFCLGITRNFKQNIFFKHVHLSNNFIFIFNFISSPAPSRFYSYHTPSMLVKTKPNPWVRKGVCACCQASHPFCLNLIVIR